MQVVGGKQNERHMEIQKSNQLMTEKDRWMLIAAICSSIASAISIYFADTVPKSVSGEG